MKIFRRIFLFLAFLFAVTFVFGYAYIKVQGRALTEKVLYHFTQQEVIFDKIAYQFPLGALISKVKIGDIGDIENISFQVNPLSVTSKHLRIREITFDRPLLRLTEERVKRVLIVS